MKSLHLVVTGRVQGVGYRYFAQRLASQLGLVGWVRNREDGAVEIEACGDAASLARFEAGLRLGPPAARVAEVSTVETAGGSWSRFEIAY
jgi:acylphosphatase